MPAATHPALHLVSDQEGTVLPGRVAQGMQEIGRQVERPGDTLYGFENDGSHVSTDHRLGRGTVVARDEVDLERFLRKAVPLVGVPGDSARCGGAAMETGCDRKHLAPLRHRAGHAQGVLVGFGARVDEEHPLERGRCDGHEFLRGLCAHLQRNGVALKQQALRLLPDRGNEPRVAVSQGGDGVPAVEVEYAPAVAGDDLAAFRMLGHERQLPVDGNRRCRFSRARVGPGCLHRVHLRSSPAECR